MIIGFDLDKVFINYPPFVPDYIINLFYKKGIFFFLSKKRKKNEICYRFPGIIEQKIRILSHTPLLRAPIKRHIAFVKDIKDGKKHELYLISSRYGFLKKQTNEALTRHKLHKFFSGIYFNFENKQPHLFKEEKLKELKVDVYIDDDLALLLYLARQLPKMKLYWISNAEYTFPLPKNVTHIKTLSEILGL